VKYLAITNVTKYENPKRLKVLDYDHVLSMTKGHIALGGGGLALFGSGCLYSWPEKLSDVPRALKDQTIIDTDYLMDDSAYRGTYGGCFATTLGALVHELGHSLDLGHTENGIMARGFDDMDRFFSICPGNTKSEHLIMRRNSLRYCGAVPKLTSTQEKSMRSGQIRRRTDRTSWKSIKRENTTEKWCKIVGEPTGVDLVHLYSAIISGLTKIQRQRNLLSSTTQEQSPS